MAIRCDVADSLISRAIVDTHNKDRIMLEELKLGTTDNPLVSARRALEQGDVSGAEILARRVLENAAMSAEAHHILARSVLNRGKLGEAVTAASEAIRLAPSYAEAHHTLAQCRLRQGAAKPALESARTAVTLVPEYAEAHFTLGTIFHRLGRLEEAEASFQAALSAKSDYVEALNHLGTVYGDQVRFGEGEAVLRKAVALRPDYADAHNNLGFILRRMGRSDEAAASFKLAHDLFEPHLVLHQSQAAIPRTVDNARRFARVSTDILRWHANGRCRPQAWNDYRLLHQATNGRSGDVFSRALARFSGRPNAQSEPWRRSAIFPWIGPTDVPAILRALDRDGIYLFDRPIATKLVDEMHEYGLNTVARLYPTPASGRTHAIFDPIAPLAAGYQFDEEPMLARPEFQKFMADPLLLSVSQSYLGVEPKLAYLALWWSAAFEKNPMSHMAQLFHSDLAHIKWLKIFVYITDVTDETGPHSFVRGSHKVDEEGRELRRRGLVRISDEDIHRTYGRDRVMDLVGPRGTVFIADTRAFHKGHLPRAGHRLALQIYYVSSLFPEVIDKNKRHIEPSDPALIEAIRRRPGVFAGYSFGKHT
jgi:Flp pilus assembly protein TadD